MNSTRYDEYVSSRLNIFYISIVLFIISVLIVSVLILHLSNEYYFNIGVKVEHTVRTQFKLG